MSRLIQMVLGAVLSALIASCSCYASDTTGQGSRGKVVTEEPSTQNNRFLYLRGPITSATIAPLQAALEMAISTSNSSTDDIDMVINSPGGSVVAGMAFINRMQALRGLGVDINCYVLDVAASMAFQILTQCTNRYALPTSFLLWHGVRMGTNQPITTSGARAIAEDLQRMDDLVLFQLEEALELDADTIRYHFDRETLWSGLGLHSADPSFILLESAYPELMAKLGSAITTAELPMFFFGGGQVPSGDTGIQYIWSEYARHIAQ